jgi:Cof subfamily protein (haloacid dehalogenase superfamily)
MKYKLIALDLDGTLFNDSSLVTEYTKSILDRLSAIGIIVVIATGRSYTSLKPKIKQLNLKYPIICYNGAMIVDSTNDGIIMNTAVPDDLSRECINIARRHKIHLHGFINGDFYYENTTKQSKYYQDLSGLEGVLTNFDNLESLSFTKCMFIGDNSELLKIEEEIRVNYEERCYMAFSKPSFLELMDFNASKSKALSKLANDYGIKKEEIIAFGDGLNDLDMLKYAGKGIAMKNGYDSLKIKFENSEFTNNEDGVAKHLEKLLNE